MDQHERPRAVTLIGCSWVLLGLLMLLFGGMVLLARFLVSPELSEYLNMPEILSLIAMVIVWIGGIGFVCGICFLRLKRWAGNILQILSWLMIAFILGLIVFWLSSWGTWQDYNRFQIIRGGVLDDITDMFIILVYGMLFVILLKYLRAGPVKNALTGNSLVEIIKKIIPALKWIGISLSACLIMAGVIMLYFHIRDRNAVELRLPGFRHYIWEGGDKYAKQEDKAFATLGRYYPKLKALGKSYPNDAEIHMGLAVLYNRYDQPVAGYSSEEEYRKAISIDPNNQALLAKFTGVLCERYIYMHKRLTGNLEKMIDYAQKKNENKIVLANWFHHSLVYDSNENSSNSYDPNKVSDSDVEELYAYFKEDFNETNSQLSDFDFVLKQLQKLKDADERKTVISDFDFMMMNLKEWGSEISEEEYNKLVKRGTIEFSDFDLAMKQLKDKLDKDGQLVLARIEQSQRKSLGNAFYDYLKAGIFFSCDKNDKAVTELKIALSRKYFNCYEDDFIEAESRVYREVNFPKSIIKYITFYGSNDPFLGYFRDFVLHGLLDLEKIYENNGDFNKADETLQLGRTVSTEMKLLMYPSFYWSWSDYIKQIEKHNVELHKKMTK